VCYPEGKLVNQNQPPPLILPQKGGKITPSLLREGRDGCYPVREKLFPSHIFPSFSLAPWGEKKFLSDE